MSLFGWEDLCARLDIHPDVVSRHYAALARFGGAIETAGTEYGTRIESFLRQYLGDTDRPPPFIGRESELAALDEWLADPKRPFELIRASAGRGKSALLANWQATLGDALALVYMPISARFRTNLAQVVLPSVLSRLSALHDRPLPSSAEVDGERARGLIADLLARPLPGGARLLLIIDGLDEAADFEITADLFPANAPQGLKVLLAGRPLTLRVDPLAALVQATRDLPLLAPNAVRTALTGAGTEPSVADRVVELVQGDPLLLRLYSDALEAGELDLRKLPEAMPGLRGFFAKWWDEQLDLWNNKGDSDSVLVESLLCVLACALGPLSRDDLLNPTLVPERPGVFRLDAALTRLGRLIVGAGRTNDLVLSHPRFGDFIREEWIPASRRREVEQRFTSWGERALTTSPASVSPYLISNLGAHLEREGSSQDRFASLTSRYWADCWYSIDPSLSGFLVDVDRRRRAATVGIQKVGRDSSLLVALVDCALTSATVRTIANGLPPEVYVAALKLHVWSADVVFEHLAKVRSRELSPSTLAAVARIVNSEWAPNLLALVLSIGNVHIRVAALTELLAVLPPEEHARALAELSHEVTALHYWLPGPRLPAKTALEIADQLTTASDRAYAMASALPSLAQPDFESVSAAIEELVTGDPDAFTESVIYDGALRNLAPERRLRVVTRILDQLGDDQAKRSALREISWGADPDLVGPLLRCAATIDDEVDRGEALSFIAKGVAQKDIEAFLTIAQAIQRPWPRARSLAALGRYHDGPWCRAALELCETETLHPSTRAPIIVDACRHLPDSGRLELEPLLMADLNAPVDSRAWDDHDPDWLLADFAETFTQTSPHDALRLISEIGTEEVRALQAATFAVHGPPDFRAQAMDMLSRVEEPWGVVDGYAYLADNAAAEDRSRICAEIGHLAMSGGYAGHLVTMAVGHAWDLERELSEPVLREALALPRVSDWHEMGEALSALGPASSKHSAGDALTLMNNIGYDMPLSRIAKAFADKFSNSHLQSLFFSVKKMESTVFAASVLEAIFPHLAPETKDEASRWARELQEDTTEQIDSKIRFLTACALTGAVGHDGLLAEAERLVLALPDRKRDDVRATILRRPSPEPRQHRRQGSATSYSRENLIAEAQDGERHRRGDTFELLVEQELKEVEGATLEALRAASAGERSSVLRVVAGLSPAIQRLGGVDAIDGVVSVLRENVESWG